MSASCVVQSDKTLVSLEPRPSDLGSSVTLEPPVVLRCDCAYVGSPKWGQRVCLDWLDEVCIVCDGKHVLGQTSTLL